MLFRTPGSHCSCDLSVRMIFILGSQDEFKGSKNIVRVGRPRTSIYRIGPCDVRSVCIIGMNLKAEALDSTNSAKRPLVDCDGNRSLPSVMNMIPLRSILLWLPLLYICNSYIVDPGTLTIPERKGKLEPVWSDASF
jgi:hypothetical protein